jgi:hypothetical protein
LALRKALAKDYLRDEKKATIFHTEIEGVSHLLHTKRPGALRAFL